MKSLFIAIIAALVITVGNTDAWAQKKSKKVETTEFTVRGVCGMCKARIENAALIKGVKLAEWDKSTQKIKVVFRADKVSIDEIHQALAEAGHKTDKLEADKEAYSKLPGCCAYDNGVKVH